MYMLNHFDYMYIISENNFVHADIFSSCKKNLHHSESQIFLFNLMFT